MTIAHLGGAKALGPPLDLYVETLWYQNIPIYQAREIILPSPYVELIFNFGQPHRVYEGADLQAYQEHPVAWLAGPQSRYITIESQTSHMVGARLKPGGAAALFPQPVSSFADRVVPLTEIIGVQKTSQLHASLLAAGPLRFTLLEDFLRAQLDPRRRGLALVLAAVARMQAAGGNINLAALSAELNVSHKHLIQQFTVLVGLRPKQFARVLRFAALLPGLAADGAPDWAALAQVAGYHDQAHFNREFQRFAGLTPRQYIQRRRAYREAYDLDGDTRFVPLG
ncbi:MAG: AraC family transcriptional regulator [Anaerolineales bacterium]|nr:AraC family transcriptional regulator [Anaerolineales bacterium]